MLSQNQSGIKKVLLTFDYELFLGKRSGSVAKCLLQPTDGILNVLAKHNAKAIFFVDALYLFRLREAAIKCEAADMDYSLIAKQIVEICNSGHYVYNHIHPHWFDAKYLVEHNQWDLSNTSKYAFQSLSEEQRKFVFEKSTAVLNEILIESKNSFSLDGYRAGGLYIQPFSIFKKYFEQYGMKYEFSVLRRAKGELQNPYSSFDFTNVSSDIYNFSEDVAVSDNEGEFTEFAMRPLEVPFFYRLINSMQYRLTSSFQKFKKFGDGVGFLADGKISIAGRSKYTATETFSIEMLSAVKLPLYFKEIETQGYLHILSHPKLVSSYNIEMFDKLLSKIGKFKHVEFDFKKML
jgi:peptidoglycan/xylan/chitin deacetylase (PgdA/CDA1 family)